MFKNIRFLSSSTSSGSTIAPKGIDHKWNLGFFHNCKIIHSCDMVFFLSCIVCFSTLMRFISLTFSRYRFQYWMFFVNSYLCNHVGSCKFKVIAYCHKNWICEITNLVVIFKKNKMTNASMPNFSILPTISDEIFPRLCSDDPIQILFKLAWFLMLRTKPFLEGFVWSH